VKQLLENTEGGQSKTEQRNPNEVNGVCSLTDAPDGWIASNLFPPVDQ
jgi:hypothetical protein